MTRIVGNNLDIKISCDIKINNIPNNTKDIEGNRIFISKPNTIITLFGKFEFITNLLVGEKYKLFLHTHYLTQINDKIENLPYEIHGNCFIYGKNENSIQKVKELDDKKINSIDFMDKSNKFESTFIVYKPIIICTLTNCEYNNNITKLEFES
jgi:hypothetical protein